MASGGVYGFVCSRCSGKVSRNNDSLICNKCEGCFHLTCGNVPEKEFVRMRADKTVKQWICAGCAGDAGRCLLTACEDSVTTQGSASDSSKLSQVSDEAVSLASEGCARDPATVGNLHSSEMSVASDGIASDDHECSKFSCVRHAVENEFLRREVSVLRRTLDQVLKRVENQEEIIFFLRNSATSVVSSAGRVSDCSHSGRQPFKQGRKTIVDHDKRTATADSSDKTSKAGYSTAVKVKVKPAQGESAEKGMLTVTEATEEKPINPSAMADKESTAVRDGSVGDRGTGLRRARRPAVIIGSNENTDKVGAVKKMGYLFVYRLRSETTESELCEFLKTTAPEIDFTCEMIKKSDVSSSFKVVFPMDRLKEVYEPNIWPKGAAVRRYFLPRKDRGTENFHQHAAAETARET